MDKATAELVHARADDNCEYCRMPQAFDDLPFQLEHIIAKQHGGANDPDNLALACVPCNLHKGTNLSGIDPHTGKIVRLFDPRHQNWKRHFRWNGALLQGKTLCGRATVRVLQINLAIRVALRQSLIDIGVFPPSVGWVDQRHLAIAAAAIQKPSRFEKYQNRDDQPFTIQIRESSSLLGSDMRCKRKVC
jgi:HNH endonuclease